MRSLRYSLDGLAHAVSTERNLRHFCIGFALVAMAAVACRVSAMDWLLLLGSGGVFACVELLNTALERAVDACDELHRSAGRHQHEVLRQSKDTAAAAALIAFIMVVAALLVVFLPHVLALFAVAQPQ